MRNRAFGIMLLAVVGLTISTTQSSGLLFCHVRAAADDQTGTSSDSGGDERLRSALVSIFNPAVAPTAKAMGLVQRTNFLDSLTKRTGRLEVAIVVDGTESMADGLRSVQLALQSMIADLKRTVGDQVYVQLLIYRDAGAESGVIEWPLSIAPDQWTKDPETIAAGLAKLQPQSGAPYFHEMVDEGLYEAITKIKWTTEDSDDGAATSRWILLVGDAPPFDPGFSEPENKAARKYSNDILLRKAEERAINIHAILCPSREADRQAYDASLQKTRNFFMEMTSGTQGLMLDLSDADASHKIMEAAQKASSKFVAITPITQQDIDRAAAAASAQAAKASKPKRLRFAVLPHLSLDKMSFSNEAANLLAEEIRSQLSAAGNATADSVELRNQFQTAKKRGLKDEQLLIFLATSLKLDYIVWGYPSAKDGAMHSTIIEGKTGKPALEIKTDSGASGSVQMCKLILNSISKETKKSNLQPSLKVAFEKEFRTRLISTSNSNESVESLADARLKLQHAIQFETTDQTESAKLLEDAEKILAGLKESEGDNAIFHSLVANTLFNQWLANPNGPKAKVLRQRLKAAANAADKYIDRVPAADRDEIRADLNFYVDKFAEATKLYESIVAANSSQDSVRRAHWMLIGIYAGDWGVDKKVPTLVDVNKSREHAIQLMALYPESHEARAVKKALLWNDAEGKTLSAHLPLTGTPE